MVSIESIYFQCLAQAETSAESGRFQTAKVFRAVAHVLWRRSLERSRTSLHSESPGDQVLPFLRKLKSEEEAQSPQLVNERLLAILSSALEQLPQTYEIPFDKVPESVWGCPDCEYISANTHPERCPKCQAPGKEFSWYGPFFSGTRENLCRKRKEQIVSKLHQTIVDIQKISKEVDLENLTTVDKSLLTPKEIIGHMLDVTDLFSEWFKVLSQSKSPQVINYEQKPWEIFKTKGYNSWAASDLVQQFHVRTEEEIRKLEELPESEWLKTVIMTNNRMINAYDLGSWLCNHNIGHYAQLKSIVQRQVAK